ncbi:right-handed parallel beta-helix repeat-containing protein [Flavisolibacter nicotianae]|uniref:right-handed parallel beta-helix repeat-containing protein n=1 Tax=Flavisolibacter nicotianae TaxID=2364882 RepID=UPI000EAD0BDC|nr:right-handed parallel beta-helix repeat-containing protein [Flavisolibacter nicotianae]
MQKKIVRGKKLLLALALLTLALAGICFMKAGFRVEHKQAGNVYYIHADTPLQAVNALRLQAGDSVLFQRGGKWKGAVTIRQSGLAGRPIYVGAYGTGSKPVITTRTAFPDWKNPSRWRKIAPTTWAYTYRSPTNKSYRVWLDGIEYQRAKDSNAISSTRRFSYLSDFMILYVYAPSNPATYYKAIDYPSDETGTLNLFGVSHLVLENLDIQGSSGGSIDLSVVDDIVIRNCSIGLDAGHCGIRGFTRADNVTISNCEISSGDKVQDYFLYQNGIQDGIAMYTGCHNWLIDGNYIHDWGHSDIELSDISDQANDTVPPVAALLNGRTVSNIDIRRNLCKAANVDYCRGLGLDSRRWHRTENIVVHYNWFDSLPVRNQVECNGAEFSYNLVSNIRNSPLPELWYGVGQGIMITPYGYTGAQDMKIVGNTIVNCDEAGITLSSADDPHYGQVRGNLIANNILANNGRVGTNAMKYVQLAIEPTKGKNIGGNIYRNNLLYSANSEAVFHDIRVEGKSAYMTVDRLNAYGRSIYGDVADGNRFGDPMFESPVDFRLRLSSPAIGTGFSFGKLYNKALAPPSSWPNGVRVGLQAAKWNIGAFVLHAGSEPL